MFSKKISALAIELIVYSNLWVAICFACFAEVIIKHMGLEVDAFFFYSVASVVFLYNYTRQVSKGDPIRKDAGHYKKVQTYLEKVNVLMMLIGLFYALFQLQQWYSQKLLMALLPVVLLSLSYVLPTGKGLRWLPGFKMYVIAGSWSYFACVLPWVISGAPLETPWFSYLFTSFLVVLALCIPFDIRDAEADDISLKTLPAIIGWKKSRYLSGILMMSGLMGLSILNTNFVWANLFFMIVFVLFLFRSTPKRSSLYFDLFMEGLPVLWLAAAYFIPMWSK